MVINHRDLKAVNVWFQNKRRSMKKKCIAWNRATALMAENAFGMGHRYFSTPANPSKQTSLLRRNSAISLDSVASSRERRDSPDFLRPPLTPRKNLSSRTFSLAPQPPQGKDYETHLWDHLLSSPLLPPSSPTKETDILSNLPSRSKTMKSLEWACAKDRIGRAGKTKKRSTKRRETEVMPQVEEERAGVPELDLDSLDDGTEPDDTLITPDNSMLLSVTESCDSQNTEFKKEDPRAEDVEAAMALLGFKVYNLSTVSS